jgi:ubiquinone/menaquinone biosynthesis C-methylase UbiE
MNLLAQRRLLRQGKAPLLVNALAQQLPFIKGSFHQVVATFPTEFLIDQQTLQEVHRVLIPEGTFLSLPATLITGKGLLARGAAWLFRVTGQTISPDESWHKHVADIFTAAGFNVEIEVREEAFSTLIFIRAVAGLI